jgi:hypothetical protein
MLIAPLCPVAGFAHITTCLLLYAKHIFLTGVASDQKSIFSVPLALRFFPSLFSVFSVCLASVASETQGTSSCFSDDLGGVVTPLEAAARCG